MKYQWGKERGTERKKEMKKVRAKFTGFVDLQVRGKIRVELVIKEPDWCLASKKYTLDLDQNSRSPLLNCQILFRSD